jgi:uncharacterized membrane protein YgcG
MRPGTSLLVALPLVASTLVAASDAVACGGCLHGEGENTQVTGHRMIFSISPTETTLWDQISYAGDPTSFAWVLPTKGVVTVGLSSDALFQNLDVETQVTVIPPPISCPFPACDDQNGAGGSLAFGGGGPTSADAGSVMVIAQQVVGPYQTVQLSSTDPSALATWLSANGYVIPPSFASTITDYVAEGFDFLALKLIPGTGITSMKPVRVSSPGAGASLPLRMVAAGTGVTTPITLWIFAEGRYQPSNFPFFTITPSQLVWDFAASSSNYQELKQAGFNLTNGRGWLLETSAPFSEYQLQGQLTTLAMYEPASSGYADSMGNGAPAALTDDLAKLWGDIDATKLWVTRTTAALPRAALTTDLNIGASTDQTQLPGALDATQAINTPVCPTYPPCNTTSGSGGAGGAGGASATGGGSGGSSGSCALSGEGERPATLGVMAVALLLAVGRRRKRG